MIVITGLLHQINTRPKNGVTEHADSVLITQHNPYSKDAHDDEIDIHPFALEVLKKVETNKIKSKFGFNQNSSNPAGGNRTKSLQRD